MKERIKNVSFELRCRMYKAKSRLYGTLGDILRTLGMRKAAQRCYLKAMMCCLDSIMFVLHSM